MKYKCIPCDHEFESTDAKPRCPRCMTIHDVEPLSDSKGSALSKSKPRFTGAVVLLGLLAIGIGAYFLTGQRRGSTEGDQGAVSPSALKQRLAEAGLDADEIVEPCAANDSVKALVQQAAATDGDDAPEKLMQWLRTAKEQGKWKPHPQRESRTTAPLAAGELAKKLLEPTPAAPYEALSYELSCLLLSASRDAEATAKLVEVLEFDGEQSPADPEGRLGRYAVEIGTGEKAFVLDPYSGRARASAKGRYVALDAVQEVAPYYGLAALSHLVARQTPEAMHLNEAAVALDGRSGWLRMGRGLILAASGALAEALNEMERAVKTQEEPPLLADLAEVQLMADPSGRAAEANLATALAKTPKYARAKALLGVVHLLRQEDEQARHSLEEAERLDPDSPAIKMLMARYYAAQSDTEGAIAKAKEAVRFAGGSPTALIGLAGIYGMTGRQDEMRATLDELLAKVESPAMAEEIKRLFGYEPQTAADADSDPGSDDDGAAGSQFKLRLDPGGSGGRSSKYGLGGSSGNGLDLKLDMGHN